MQPLNCSPRKEYRCQTTSFSRLTAVSFCRLRAGSSCLSFPSSSSCRDIISKSRLREIVHAVSSISRGYLDSPNEWILHVFEMYCSFHSWSICQLRTHTEESRSAAFRMKCVIAVQSERCFIGGCVRYQKPLVSSYLARWL